MPKLRIYLFIIMRKMNDVFAMDFDIERILMNLNIESGVTITPNDTLIILDEIQNAPKSSRVFKVIFVRKRMNIM